MIFKVKLYLIFALFFLMGYSYGQNLINVKHYSTVDGLSDNKITTIIKDRDGFIWFGSWAGINRFDGHNFVNYKSYPGDNSSLKSNRIDVIIEDIQAGFLWVKAYDNQVYRFDKRTGLFTALADLLNDKLIKGIFFTRIFAVAGNQVWLQTSENSLFLIQDALGSHPTYKIFDQHQKVPHQISSNPITFFHIDKKSNVWIITSKEVSVLEKKENCDYVVKSIKRFEGNYFSGVDDGKNLLWIAKGGTLFSIDYNQTISKSYKITNANITGLKSSKNGEQIFCTTSNGEIITVTEKGKVSLLGKMKDQSTLYAVFESEDGNLWIDSDKYGVVLYNKSNGKITTLFSESDFHFKPWTNNYSIYEDENHIVWITITTYGVRFYDKQQQKLLKISSNNQQAENRLSDVILRTFYDSAGILWLMTDNGGVDKVVFRKYNFEQKPVTQSNLMIDNEVRGIFTDQQNRLWLGTKGEKVFVYKNNKALENPFVNQPDFKSGVYSIFKDKDGAMWFGTKSNGLFKAIPVDASEQKYKFTQHYFEKGILKGSNNNAIYTIMQDSKGRIWVGSFGGGLILLQSANKTQQILTLDNSFKNYPSGNYRRIRYLKEDAKGNIWIATTEGLLVFNPNLGSPANYRFKIHKKQAGNIRSLGGNDIQFIYRDSQNQMWVLTSSGGLNLAKGKNPLDTLSFQNFSKKDGLPSDFLLSCTEDNRRNLWISTQNGISKFSILNKKHQNFNYFDGLNEEASFSESSGIKMANGDVVFGNTQGILRFSPDEIHSNKIEAQMVFTNILVNGDDVKLTDESFFNKQITYANSLNLDYNQNIITLDFAVLDFRSNDKQNYACRILGFDNVWRNTDGQRRITYTNLPPGKYVFQVKTLNDELYAQMPFRSLNITIHPPLWKTWWAYTLYVVVFIMILLLAQRIIYIMIKLRHGIALEKKMTELKLDFFTQISHELRTPLTLIVNPVEEVLQNEKLSAKGKKYVKLVLKNANRMTRLVNQLLDLRKVQSGKASLKSQEIELIAFIRELISHFEDIIENKQLDVKIISTRESLNVNWDVEKIEIVIYNILANAIKFSPNGGKVKVFVDDEHNGWCKIAIEDEGPGVLNNELKNIFNIYYEGENKVSEKGSGIGLALAKELVLLQQGKIYAENNEDKGLKITVEINKFIGDTFLEQQKFTEAKQLNIEGVQIEESPKNDINISTKEKLTTVLIVEDNYELRSFLSDKFSENYQVINAENGEEGLQKALEMHPDLILSDIMMPKMDGFQMLNELKNNALTSHIPVILLTAKNTIENHIQGLKYGADYYLPKPFDMKLLTAAINNILEQRKNFFRLVLDGQPVSNDTEQTIANHTITQEDKEFLEKTIQIVRERMEYNDFKIDTVADSMNMSRSSFFKKFKSLTNLPPVEFVRDTRLERGKEMIEAGTQNISEIAYSIGFNNPKYFSTCFKAKYNISPKEYSMKYNN